MIVTWCAHRIASFLPEILIETKIKQLWNTISNCIHSSTSNSIETKSLSIRCDYFEIKDDDDEDDTPACFFTSKCENKATQFAYFLCFLLLFSLEVRERCKQWITEVFICTQPLRRARADEIKKANGSYEKNSHKHSQMQLISSAIAAPVTMANHLWVTTLSARVWMDSLDLACWNRHFSSLLSWMDCLNRKKNCHFICHISHNTWEQLVLWKYCW